MNTIKILAIFAEDKAGQLNRVTQILADAGINIHHVAIADSNSGSFGVMKFVVDAPERALAALKQNQFIASFIDALAVEVGDRPGTLHAITGCLFKNNINLNGVSGFVTKSRAIILLETDELQKAEAALAAEKIPVMSAIEIMKL